MYCFDYHHATSLEEAVRLASSLEDTAFLAGGHTLLPTMKNRLAAPRSLIDIGALSELRDITFKEGVLRIGAACTHSQVSTSSVVTEQIPALAALAGSIGDAQVRHMGTMGGSVANNDPSADYPSAVLGLGATVETDRRSIPADEFFRGLYTTALEENELIVAISFPVPESAGYSKYRSPASRYALAGAFVSLQGCAVRVAVTGAGQDGIFRWAEAEVALAEQCKEGVLDGLLPDEGDMLADMHAAADFRANLVNVVTRRAVAHLGGTDIL